MADSRRRQAKRDDTRRDDDDKRQKNQPAVRGPRPFWSGTISFGLVNLPVGLYPAQHGKPVRLRMVDAEGTPLARRYYCEKEAKILTGSELIRGYEVKRNDYVLVEDRELEALAPEKSQDIDLERFVGLDEIAPIYFERAYFLTPEEGATRAYRLLADSMESASRAGIATFVMRGKQYLVAIIAEQGILRAETLRYHDELRSPESIGLPERQAASGEARRRIGQAIDNCSSPRFERSWLENADARRILERVDAKLEQDEDVVWPADADAEEEDDSGEVVDLMQVLKQSLSEGRSPTSARAKPQQSTDRQSRRGDERKKRKESQQSQKGSKPDGKQAKTRSRAGGTKRGRSRRDDEQLNELSRQALYQRAQEMDIAGRSQMTKAELIEAIHSAA